MDGSSIYAFDTRGRDESRYGRSNDKFVIFD